MHISSIDPTCRTLAREALQERYHMPRIELVTESQITFGTHYWTVETDRGVREFAFKEPGKNVTWLNDDHIVIRDTAGNRFEIESLESLNAASRAGILAIL